MMPNLSNEQWFRVWILVVFVLLLGMLVRLVRLWLRNGRSETYRKEWDIDKPAKGPFLRAYEEEKHLDSDTEGIQGSLKTWPDYFQLQWDGEKTFEVRLNDRQFQEGQLYYLAEYRPDWTNPCPNTGQPYCSADGEFTGRRLLIRIKYVMQGPCFGLAKGWAAFGYSIVSRIAAYDEADLKPLL